MLGGGGKKDDTQIRRLWMQCREEHGWAMSSAFHFSRGRSSHKLAIPNHETMYEAPLRATRRVTTRGIAYLVNTN
jgi:hypothetical protein